MKEDESVVDFFSRLMLLMNQVKVYGESLNDLKKIEKVLRSLTANFDYIIVSIKESKNLAKMKLEEVQAFLEAHEMKLKKKELREKDDDEAQYAHDGESDYDDMLLMENTSSNNEQTNVWYLDSRCSNQLASNKNWFTKLDESVKKVIKFTDGRHITSEGRGNIVVVRRNGQRVSITDILYLPSMTSNLISICQLLAKGYNMKLEQKLIKVYDGEGRIFLKAPLEDNKTFKI
ncbi:uncharacterized protein LOC127082500 [Lathyrus oleraceus]|uniref:uncharacterized protein LOC127082500 n=1 Tax=Pisum sativum TaxID=3888 RepID=UPI0021CF0B97|nr:uncharacterized protein LOC127082500 [Pisum sativum]